MIHRSNHSDNEYKWGMTKKELFELLIKSIGMIVALVGLTYTFLHFQHEIEGDRRADRARQNEYNFNKEKSEQELALKREENLNNESMQLLNYKLRQDELLNKQLEVITALENSLKSIHYQGQVSYNLNKVVEHDQIKSSITNLTYKLLNMKEYNDLYEKTFGTLYENLINVSLSIKDSTIQVNDGLLMHYLDIHNELFRSYSNLNKLTCMHDSLNYFIDSYNFFDIDTINKKSQIKEYSKFGIKQRYPTDYMAIRRNLDYLISDNWEVSISDSILNQLDDCGYCKNYYMELKKTPLPQLDTLFRSKYNCFLYVVNDVVNNNHIINYYDNHFVNERDTCFSLFNRKYFDKTIDGLQNKFNDFEIIIDADIINIGKKLSEEINAYNLRMVNNNL